MSRQGDTIFLLNKLDSANTTGKIDSVLNIMDSFSGSGENARELPHKEDSIEMVPLVNKSLPGHPMKAKGNEWVFGVLVLASLLFVSVKMVFNKYLTGVFHAIINQQTSSRMFRESNYKFFHGAHRLNLIFYLAGSLFLYQYINSIDININITNSIRGYLLCLGLILGYFILKFFALYGLGILVNRKNEMTEYLFNIALYNKVLGLFLGIIAFFIAFLPFEMKDIWLTSGLIITAIIYLMSLVRGALIFIKRHFSVFYMILYLCTLEILPLLLIYKFIFG